MNAFDWFILALCAVGVALLFCGCETAGSDTRVGYTGDAELVALAKDIRPQEPPVLLKIEWGDESLCWPDRITIDRTTRGTKWARVHLRHELDELWSEWLGVDDADARARLERDHRING